MPEFDLAIRGGTVVTASDTVRADVGVRGGRSVAGAAGGAGEHPSGLQSLRAPPSPAFRQKATTAARPVTRRSTP
ncbi:hypothetical protein CCS92_34425 [Methylobacterium radiotolerans]|nr:hypothetical protein CCS92_34425 [Methylobacterium radiotolerans]